MMAIDWPLDENFIRRGLENHTYGPVRNGGKRNHQGWDFYAEPGTPCFAIADGTVVKIRNVGDYGLQVIIRFDFKLDGKPSKLFAFYAHLSRADVKEGQSVKLGQQVGLTGNSGNASTMRGKDQHLHFEIRTTAITGRGLDGRMSPLRVLGHCPLQAPVFRTKPEETR
jgi:murein DD-endopeptidase MepM/ murein hydrolase activator NlpD